MSVCASYDHSYSESGVRLFMSLIDPNYDIDSLENDWDTLPNAVPFSQFKDIQPDIDSYNIKGMSHAIDFFILANEENKKAEKTHFIRGVYYDGANKLVVPVISENAISANWLGPTAGTSHYWHIYMNDDNTYSIMHTKVNELFLLDYMKNQHTGRVNGKNDQDENMSDYVQWTHMWNQSTVQDTCDKMEICHGVAEMSYRKGDQYMNGTPSENEPITFGGLYMYSHIQGCEYHDERGKQLGEFQYIDNMNNENCQSHMTMGNPVYTKNSNFSKECVDSTGQVVYTYPSEQINSEVEENASDASNNESTGENNEEGATEGATEGYSDGESDEATERTSDFIDESDLESISTHIEKNAHIRIALDME